MNIEFESSLKDASKVGKGDKDQKITKTMKVGDILENAA